MDLGLRPFAWCGWRLDVPTDWRPFMIDGNARTGAAGLADENQRRLVLQWHALRKPPSLKRIKQMLVQDALPRRRAALAASVEPVEHADLHLFHRLRDEEGGVTRFAGWSPVSGRLIDAMYRRSTPRQDRLVEPALVALMDQPPDQPQQWAYFDTSFVAPAGMIYRSASLKFGDMGIELDRPRRKGVRAASVVVRVVYPADLALSRMPIDQWLAMFLAQDRPRYRPPRDPRGPEHNYEPLRTTLGPGLTCDAPLRLPLQWTRWTTPRLLRSELFHDAARNRLILLQTFAHPDEAEALLTELRNGLYWAGDRSTPSP